MSDSLRRLSNILNETRHQELDSAVLKEPQVVDFLNGINDLKDAKVPYFIMLLEAIIENSDGLLNKKYRYTSEARALLGDNPGLRAMLALAWQNKSFCDIRNLAILRAEEFLQNPGIYQEVDPNLSKILSTSFVTKYRGAAVDGFYEYLTQNENLFKTPSNILPRHYAKFCSIVQSSGTGKSRMLTELSTKDVIVIYMNLREEWDKSGFPLRDQIPSQILTTFPDGMQAYQAVCFTFFAALFDTLCEYLPEGNDGRTTKTDTMDWARMMCDMDSSAQHNTRQIFFEQVSEKYEQIYADFFREPRRRSNGGEDQMVVDTVGGLPVPAQPKKKDPPSLITTRLNNSYKLMAGRLENQFSHLGRNSDKPKLVIVIDEAQPLTLQRGEGKAQYRPVDLFCRAVNEFSHLENHAIWVVFASTTSRVADLSPPNQMYPSGRVSVNGQRLFSPYTQLGWDQTAVGFQQMDIEAISRIDHVASFGRPLWHSLKLALEGTEKVVSLASRKLCGGQDMFQPSERSHVLAVLGQRFGLDVALGHPDSVAHLEDGVSSHLRICTGTTHDRIWKFTSYPSEPFLSCMAATLLHKFSPTLDTALRTLLSIVNSGMIELGQQGELASRLLWLLAKDLFVRQLERRPGTEVPSKWDEHLLDCHMVPVVDWLTFTFGPQVWEGNELARTLFNDAYMNFSHWICMDTNIPDSTEPSDLPLDEWTLRLWQRTSAVQCCRQQPLVDKVIPIYFKGGPINGPATSRMSQIFISDKVRRSKDSKGALDHITRQHENLGGEKMSSSADYTPLPYIAILADFGQPPSLSVTWPERDNSDPCLRIYAAGVDTSIYPFLAGRAEVIKALQTLVLIQQIPETEESTMHYLDTQVKFGTTPYAAHMQWEKWAANSVTVEKPSS